jgi:[pyruvate, water dikinase]-phosphate phosphotransferase / [pyruvate, water dikinase] kinase
MTVEMQRVVFFVSDGTGITAETLGASLLTQFEGISFKKVTLPFINTPDKARVSADYINHVADTASARPIIFSTTVNDEVRGVLRGTRALFLDLFDAFITPIESELGVKSTHATGRAHSMADINRYHARIDAMNFAMEHDDGQSVRDLERADVVLIAPSRCGKTPTTLYLALQHAVFATNFPLTEEDLEQPRLTSDPERLSQVRSERRPGSKYAGLAQCSYELRQAEQLYRRLKIPHLNSANMSIEEIAAMVMEEKGLRH